jgi:hypothetical protein
VLLTSLKKSESHVANNLASIFKKKLRRHPFILKIIHNADKEILHKELISNQNIAVFWVSHGAFNSRRGGSDGIGLVPLILDFQKENVASLFSMINPQIKFLGVIGCNTEQILGYYKNEEKSETNLISYVSKRKSVATFAFKKALRKFTRAWRKRKLQESPLIVQSGISIKITRSATHSEKDLPALIIENDGKFLGVLPSLISGEESSYDILLPIPENFQYTKSKFHIKLKTGVSSMIKEKSNIFGAIKIENEWSLFTKPDGTPFGNQSRLFLFQSDDSILEKIKPFTNFRGEENE